MPTGRLVFTPVLRRTIAYVNFKGVKVLPVFPRKKLFYYGKTHFWQYSLKRFKILIYYDYEIKYIYKLVDLDALNKNMTSLLLQRTHEPYFKRISTIK